MSQAEIAGGALTPSNELPSKGHRMHDFVLMSAVGGSIQLSDYRGRANLVLILADGRPETTKLLADVGDHYAEMKDENAEVLAIVRAAPKQAARIKQQLKLPYPVLADEDGRVLRQLGGIDSDSRDSTAAYVTDRFGEVFGAYRSRDGQPLPALADILNWLEFVNSQCPECEPPEWPA